LLESPFFGCGIFKGRTDVGTVEDGVYEQTEAENAFSVGSDRTGQRIQKREMKSIDER
jgi:hypothetical protein